ncbi:chemotaxis protein CheW [Shewanella sp. UCD-KL12]|uniref:chemotaxis protein CheW n=1 Tax=Shewanella sp. UCD-KL12 TaxID=1917163 RepID=UPI0009710B83|nr:chemotaxis protein CheW [Shewanella sp. UCD-KL12]
MTSLVDEAVFDYFSVLLADTEDESITVATEVNVEAKAEAAKPNIVTDKKVKEKTASPIANKRELESPQQEPQVQPALSKAKPVKPTATVAAKPRLDKVEPQLDKQALEQLLAPVFKPEVKAEIKTEAQTKIEAKTSVNAKLATETKPHIATTVKVEPKIQEKSKAENTQKVRSSIEIKAEVEQQVASTPPKVTKDLLETLDDEFQVLFFKVAGLTLAVPLVSLGGIVQLERVNHIMGRPSWYKGVQTHRESQLNIVDTCAWVMPEKYDKSLAETVNYQYVVLLEDSNWGLTCESLVNSVKINKSAVNWRSNAGKRPWLAGVVREQMCGILHVDALIELLNAGLGSQDPVG